MDNPHPISFGALVNGLIVDLRSLLRQESQLAQHEMQNERSKLISIAIRSGMGLLFGMSASLCVLLMLVHALHAATPLPLWACYGIVGLLSLVTAASVLLSVARLGETLRLWPFRTFHSLKEDLQWIKEQVLSTRT
ncbi:MAG: phage holin family protein [Nitrospira sp.]|nr:phage holin family protein [Nitrospira sp.]